MTIEIDHDVRAVADFMQSNCSAAKLVGVATAIGKLAPSLWGHHQAEEIVPLRLSADPPIG